jgi:hypothetical protein
MSRLFLLTFDGLPEDKDGLLRYLDTQDEITDWHTSMSNTVFLETRLNLAELLSVLRKGPISSFIAVEIRPGDYRTTVAGWLPRATWEFIERKSIAGLSQ